MRPHPPGHRVRPQEAIVAAFAPVDEQFRLRHALLRMPASDWLAAWQAGGADNPYLAFLALADDVVVTGGVDALNDILMFMCFAQTGALSLTGDCRPFSDAADGTLLGEGIGMLALRRLDAGESGI